MSVAATILGSGIMNSSVHPTFFLPFPSFHFKPTSSPQRLILRLTQVLQRLHPRPGLRFVRRFQMLAKQILAEELLVLVALPIVMLALEMRHKCRDIALASLPAELMPAEAACVGGAGGLGGGLEGEEGVLHARARP